MSDRGAPVNGVGPAVQGDTRGRAAVVGTPSQLVSHLPLIGGGRLVELPTLLTDNQGGTVNYRFRCALVMGGAGRDPLPDGNKNKPLAGGAEDGLPVTGGGRGGESPISTASANETARGI